MNAGGILSTSAVPTPSFAVALGGEPALDLGSPVRLASVVAAPSGPPSMETGSSERTVAAKPRPRVMIVEDEALIALDLERRLRRLGYDVVGIADNHDEAVDLFAAHLPDLVLLDIFIQGKKDGIDVARTLLSHGDQPVIFLTAYADDKTIQRAAEVSPYGYLLKPFDERTLVATLTLALERYANDTRTRLLSAALESATIGIVLVDVQGREPKLVQANDAFVAMTGATREMVLQNPPCFLAANGSEEAVLRLREAVAERKRAEGVVMGRTTQGTTFWTSVMVSPVKTRGGRVTHMILFHQDVTSRYLAEATLLASQRLELAGHLSVGVAHDFNNVLSVILASVNHARERSADSEVREALDDALTAARRGGALSRQLMSFTRDDDSLDHHAEDLSRVLSDSRGILRRLLGTGSRLEIEIDPEPAFVSASATALQQVLMNLVNNARDAMAPGGRVRIVSSQQRIAGGNGGSRRVARIEVSDIGVGMDEHTLAHLFEPLFTTKPAGQGTGVGLYTSKLLIERAGGTIQVKSTLGQGTTFTIDLPLSEYRSTVETENLDESIRGRADGARCLLVQDDPALLRSSARILADLGFELSVCADSDGARRELETLGASLRVLILDSTMSDLDTQAMTAAAKRLAPHASVLLLAGNGGASEEPVERDPQSTILWKPFTSSSLARSALAALERAQRPDDATNDAEGMAPAGGQTPQAHVVSPRTASTTRSEPRPSRVLIVDDEQALRKAYRRALEDRGLQVVEAANGAEALHIASEQPDLQLCIFDLNLPDTDGIKLANELRIKNATLPFIVVTGDRSVETVQRSLQARAMAHLTKPFEPAQLAQEAERAIAEGQMAKLRHELLASKLGSGVVLRDVATTSKELTEAFGTLRMVFQPIVRAHDYSIAAFEALMRPNSPAFRDPPSLLSAAEILGRVEDVGHVVRARIAQALQQAPQRSELIFINLHPLEFTPELLLRPEEPLLPYASRIVLEVTERAQFSEGNNLPQTLRELRDAGFQIALDDLGEGYAGLSWLLKLNPDIAKLDMSLVRDIHTSRTKRNLVSSLVQFCRRGKIRILAEGVETEQEAAVLIDLGCELLQGYYFARPGPPFPTVERRAKVSV